MHPHDSHYIVKRPLITEKGTWEATHPRKKGKAAGQPLNRYSFLVDLNATRTQIKAAVQEIYGVKVKKVRVQVRKGVHTRTKWGYGKTPDWKRATVELAVDQKIDLF